MIELEVLAVPSPMWVVWWCRFLVPGCGMLFLVLLVLEPVLGFERCFVCFFSVVGLCPGCGLSFLECDAVYQVVLVAG